MADKAIRQSREFKRLYQDFIAEYKDEWADQFQSRLAELNEIEVIKYEEKNRVKKASREGTLVSTSDRTIPDWKLWAQVLWTSLKGQVKKDLAKGGSLVLSTAGLVSHTLRALSAVSSTDSRPRANGG